MTENIENKKIYKRISGGGIFRFLSYIAFGITIFTSMTTRFNIFYVMFGIIVYIVFVWFYKHFLRIFLGLFNPSVRKEFGKNAIPSAVDNSMLFLIPFATMSILATYFLKWSISNVFVSTGIMAVGTAASIEISKLRDNPSIKNTLITSAVSFVFSLLMTMSIQLLSRIPGIIEGAFNLIPTFLGKGGGII